MPRTRSLAWSELKIGIITVVALALAVILIVAVGGQGGFTWDRYTLKTKFSNVAGLKSGAVVRVAGVEVGKVTDVQLEGAEVLVTLGINEEHQQRITDQSRAVMGSLSLLGEPIIEVTPAAQGRPLQDGEFLQSDQSAVGIAELGEPIKQGIDQLTALLQDVRTGRGTIGKLFTDEQMYKEFNALLASAERVVGDVQRGRGTLGRLAQDEGVYRELNASLTNLNEMTRKIRAGEGSLGRLLNDDAIAKSVASASSNLEEITGRLKAGEGTAGQLLTNKQLFERLNAMTERIDRLVGALEKGEGSAGQFLHDKKLYDNMNGAATELRSLIAEIKKDPRKYLNVRVSIF